MSAITDAAAALTAALRSVDGVRVYTDLGANLDPPAIVVDAPSLLWEGFPSEPTSARWLVYVVVKNDDRYATRLWDLVPAVARAIDAVQNAAVIRADPGRFLTGTEDLPCYEITVEVSL